MSVKINGFNKLKSNWYKTIMIRECQEYDRTYDFLINIKVEEINLKTIKNKNSINLNHYTDLEKVDYVVSSFLKDTKINELNECISLSHYYGVFNKVGGSRDLYLAIKDKRVTYIYKKILNKYLIDRCDFAYNNYSNSYEFITSYKKSSYEVSKAQNISLSHNMNLDNTVCFCFKTCNKKLLPFEKEFITEFINYKLKNIGEKAEIIWSKIYSEIWENYIYAKYLVCGDLKIRICDDKDLSNCIYNIVYNYNNNREEIKKKQLKMEV